MWDQKLWGIMVFYKKIQYRCLAGEWWCSERSKIFKDNPIKNQITRALLFRTRKHAREWLKNEKCIYQSDRFKFKIVKVRETVRVIK